MACVAPFAPGQIKSGECLRSLFGVGEACQGRMLLRVDSSTRSLRYDTKAQLPGVSYATTSLAARAVCVRMATRARPVRVFGVWSTNAGTQYVVR